MQPVRLPPYLTRYLWLAATAFVGYVAGNVVARDPTRSIVLLALTAIAVAIVLRPQLVLLLNLPALIIVALFPSLQAVQFALLLAGPAAAGFSVLTRQRRFTMRTSWPLLALGLLAVVSAARAGRAPDTCPISICAAGTPSSARELVVSVLVLMNAASAGVLALKSHQIVTVLRWSTSVVAVLALFGQLDTLERTDERIGALGLNPNYLGALLALGLVTSASEVMRTFSATSLLQSIVLGVSVASTGSRGAFAGIAVGLVIVLFADRRRTTRVALGAVAAVALGVSVLVNTSPEVTFGRDRQELNANNAVRVDAARLAGELSLGNPVTGIGPGHFPSRALVDGDVGLYINTHNEYLRFGAELGLGGAALFGIAIVSGLRRASRTNRTAFALLGAFATMLLFANLTSNPIVSVAPLSILVLTGLEERPVRSSHLAARQLLASGPAGPPGRRHAVARVR